MKLVLSDYMKIAIPIYGRFGEKGRVVHRWWGQQTRWKEAERFWQEGNTDGIIQENTSVIHWFVLKDLIPMNFFK